MITVTMNDGVKRQYNTAMYSQIDGAWLKIGREKDVHNTMICQIRIEQVLMWEWNAPCRVYKPSKPKSK